MILRDRVDILDGDTVVKLAVPAHVGYRTVGALSNTEHALQLTEKLAVILPPTAPIGHPGDGFVIRWRGTLYDRDGPAMPRRRGDKDHHVTVMVKRVTG